MMKFLPLAFCLKFLTEVGLHCVSVKNDSLDPWNPYVIIIGYSYSPPIKPVSRSQLKTSSARRPQEASRMHHLESVYQS